MECESCPMLLAKTQSCPIVGDSSIVYPMVALSFFPYLLSFIVLFLWLCCPTPTVRLLFKAGLWTFGTGQLLKEVIQQDRPLGACSHSYGMPSNHSALISCFVTIQLLSHKFNWKSTLGLLCLLAGVVVSRVYLNYHTPMQCAAGTVYGAAMGVWLVGKKEEMEGKVVS